MENQNLERAKEFFGANEGIDKVYFTSDGNMFRAAIYAANWNSTLTDKEIVSITRGEANGEAKPDDDTTGQTGGAADDQSGAGAGQTGQAGGTADDEKKEARRRYIELFDKQPVGMSHEKILEKIATKEAEPAQ